jgi:hypothetical protein
MDPRMSPDLYWKDWRPRMREQISMRRVMVRYKVKPDRAAENEQLVRAVYEELRRTEPEDFAMRRSSWATASASSTSHRSRPRTGIARCRRCRRSGGSRRTSAIAATSPRWPPSSARSGRFAYSMASSVVHLELHTRDLRRARAFYSRLLDWRTEQINARSRSYLALDRIEAATGRARRLGPPCCSSPARARAVGAALSARPTAGR